MKDKNEILDKSFDFAVRIIKLSQFLQKDKNEFILSKQLLRSGTSIGANINEAQAAQSKRDFISKLSISSKEARESKYWLDLLIATNFLNHDDTHVSTLVNENIELIKLLTTIIKSAQNSLNKE